MADLRYTLLSDGTSDKALIPILTWLLRFLGVESAIQSEWADLWRLPVKPRSTEERIVKSVELYPCDLLFVHRDAEGETLEERVNQIRAAVEEACHQIDVPPVISVVPVRMQEAWLLFDEAAIRRAAGNPNGQSALRMPELRRIEDLADPKAELHNLLRIASGLSGRRLRKLNVRKFAIQVTGYIEDFSPLRSLSAFQYLETQLRERVEEKGWNS
jgi:hypothetical protein